MSERPNPTHRRAPGWALVGAWIALLAGLRASSDNEVDAFWMVREGVSLLQGAPLVHPDTWSWAPLARDFVPTSPLWQILLGASWQLLGVPGIYLLAWLSIGLALIVTALISRRLGAGPELTVGILVIEIVLGAPLFVARAALPALALFLLLLFFGSTYLPRLGGLRLLLASLLSFALFAAVTGLGLWLHASWSAYGPVALLALGAQTMREPTLGAMRRLLVVASGTLGTLIGIAIGPRGFAVFADTARVAQECRNIVIEWMPPLQLGAIWAIAWALTGAALFATAIRQRRSGLAWSAPSQLLVLVAIGAWVCGSQATRFLITAWYLSLPIVIVVFTRLWTSRPTSDWLRSRMEPQYWRPVLWALLPVLVPILIIQTNSAYAPIMDSALQALPPSCQLFAKDDLSSPVVLVRPDVKVWIDGRLDYWGRERMITADRYLQSREQLIAPAGTTCILVSSDVQVPIRTRLNESWQRVAVGSTVEVWVPRDSESNANA